MRIPNSLATPIVMGVFLDGEMPTRRKIIAKHISLFITFSCLVRLESRPRAPPTVLGILGYGERNVAARKILLRLDHPVISRYRNDYLMGRIN